MLQGYLYRHSFFPRTARLWNSLPVECFPLTYDPLHGVNPSFFKKKNPLILEANWGKSLSYFGDQESASVYKMSSYSHAFSQSVCIIMTNGCTFEPSSNVHYVGGNISVNVVTCT